MGFTSQMLTGLWSRTIKRLTDNEEVQFLEVKIDQQTVERLKALQVGDNVQIWPNDQRKNDNSPTHTMRFRRKSDN